MNQDLQEAGGNIEEKGGIKNERTTEEKALGEIMKKAIDDMKNIRSECCNAKIIFTKCCQKPVCSKCYGSPWKPNIRIK